MASALNGPWHGRRVAGRAGSAPAPSWHHSSCGVGCSVRGAPGQDHAKPPEPMPLPRKFSGICSSPEGPPGRTPPLLWVWEA